MIRFANPGSDISSFTRIFQVLFEELQEEQPFSLDDISAALVRRNLATSSGYAGEEALARSTRSDRSRDPLYNQSKMYSELFRLLGWFHPTADSRLSFVLTWMGAHVAAAGPHAKPLVAECLLGIAFPNEVVAAKGDYRLRPFALILRTMEMLNGLLCRDEMIVGPLSLDDDTEPEKVRKMAARLKGLRGRSSSRLDEAVNALATKRKTQINTLENYTRFPLAVLEWSGWTEKVRDSSAYGRSIVFHRLSDGGRAQLALIQRATDLRVSMLENRAPQARHAAAQLGAVSMLERAGFDATGLAAERKMWASTLAASGLVPNIDTPLLFSPFQELSPAEVVGVFGKIGTVSTSPRAEDRKSLSPGSVRYSSVTTVRMMPASRVAEPRTTYACVAGDQLRTILRPGRNIQTAAEEVVARFENANKGEFYPTVAELLCLLGYHCDVSRGGVNYQRCDAFITHPTDSVPVEIKSPGEERFISVKGVRQALENKVILLSRKAAPTKLQTTSLVVGYLPPNDRAEVAGLIGDIHSAFGLTIGVVDFRSLALLAASAVNGIRHDSETFLRLKGFIDVASP
jgi:hypothetical protein